MVFGLVITGSLGGFIIGASFEAFREIKRMLPKAPEVVQEESDTKVIVDSPHPYPDDANYTRTISFPGASAIKFTFDDSCSTENCDRLLVRTGRAEDKFSGYPEKQVIYDDSSQTYIPDPERSGASWTSVIVLGDTACYQFTSDGSVTDWGYRLTAEPIDAEGIKFSTNGYGIPPSCEIVKDSDNHYTVESNHPYIDNSHDMCGPITIEGATGLKITFDVACEMEEGCDWIAFDNTAEIDENNISERNRFSGSFPRWITFPGDTVSWLFHSDQSCTRWGYKFTVEPTDEVGDWLTRADDKACV